MRPKLDSLKTHEKCATHKNKIPKSQTNILTQIVKKAPRESKTSNETKATEIELAVTIASHSAIRSADHFTEYMKKHGEGSVLGGVKVHRTKCAKLLENVVAPDLKKYLVQDTKDRKYCLLIDESTDVGNIKLLVICVRYVSLTKNEIATAFVSLLSVSDTTAATIFNEIVQELTKCDLSISDCIGFGSDEAAAMVGEHNSVFSRNREASPQCVQMRCVCHSLALCIQHAFGKLPVHVGYLISEIPIWFINSSLRRDAFVNLFKVMNTEMDCEMSRPVGICHLRKHLQLAGSSGERYFSIY